MRILHCSDIHFCRPPARLRGKRLIGWLNWRLVRGRKHDHALAERLLDEVTRSTPDVVAISGDVAQLGAVAELHAAREWLERLAATGATVLLVPGNHDCYIEDDEARAVLDQMLADFGGASSDAASGLRLARTGAVEWLLLSQATPQAWWMSAGCMDDATWAALDAMPPPEDGVTRITLGHFPLRLTDGRPLPRTHALRDGHRLEEMLPRIGCRLLLCGHIHSPCMVDLDGGLRQVVAGSLTAKGVYAEIDVDESASDHPVTVSPKKI